MIEDRRDTTSRKMKQVQKRRKGKNVYKVKYGMHEHWAYYFSVLNSKRILCEYVSDSSVFYAYRLGHGNIYSFEFCEKYSFSFHNNAQNKFRTFFRLFLSHWYLLRSPMKGKNKQYLKFSKRVLWYISFNVKE